MAQEEKRKLTSEVLRSLAKLILNNVYLVFPSTSKLGILDDRSIEYFLREKWFVLVKVEIFSTIYYLIVSPDMFNDDYMWCISNSKEVVQQECNTHEAAWNLLTGPTKEHKSLKNLAKKFAEHAEKRRLNKEVSDIQYTEIEFDF